MNSAFTDDQLALAAAVGQVLRAHCPAAAVRDGRTAAWPQLAGIGLFGLLVPAEHGGLGLGLVDAVLPFEEAGRAALPGPVAETVVAAPLLLAGDPVLDKLAAGSLRVSVRIGDQDYSPDADLADLLIVERGGVPYAVRPDAARLTLQPGVDRARRLFGVEFRDGTRLRAGAAPAARAMTVTVAAQLIGAARHLLDTTVGYARTRRQFGSPIGSFQAVKHQLAEVAIAVDFAAPLVYAAAFAVDRDLPTVDRDVSAAKAAAGEAAELAARTALQVHGAIGYTGELDLGLWLARVWSLSAAYGGTALHRSRLREAILGAPVLRRWP
ncbi:MULTISPECIES: acyl-CoA dehydrogenase family protein [Streptosporangium]|uniref:Alkylation response protein AidB-like acyl-CoA dehydrogenase n=1 Tax=Streptosporangium brasiliense TaxID=47480 RepID=A0ABT9QVR5_9ACTN|nr:acyl-CoA dehydrogenase family protein [Streptosporangium brasiliense]MDP9861076.1 alkylation response protein AidB-like acyl-CoA dehydrogenase [Streptosporangium brasiliense]